MANQNHFSEEEWLETSNLKMKVSSENPVDSMSWYEGYSDPYLVVNLSARLQSFEVASDEGSGYKGVVVPGDFSFVPPGMTLGGCYQGKQMCYVSITFPKERLNPLFIDSKPIIMANDSMVRAFAEALALRRDRTGADELLYRESISEALVQHLQLIHLKPSYSISQPSIDFERLADYVRLNLEQKITVADLANIEGISSQSLQHKIREQFDQSVYEWVTTLRLEKSLELLRNTKLSLAAIAISAGFSHQSHWTRLFKQKFGTTPGKIQRP